MPRDEEKPAEDECRPDLPSADGIAAAISTRQREGEQRAPATRCRTDIARNGGRSRMTIASATNVEPQTT